MIKLLCSIKQDIIKGCYTLLWTNPNGWSKPSKMNYTKLEEAQAAQQRLVKENGYSVIE